MTIIQINSLNAKTLQALLTRSPHILRVRVLRLDKVGGELEAEFGREENIGAFSGFLKPLTDNIFIVGVDVGGIPEVLANLPGTVKDLELVLFGARIAVGASDAHGAETDGGNLGAIAAEGASWDCHLGEGPVKGW